jgi:hypothetical protein
LPWKKALTCLRSVMVAPPSFSFDAQHVGDVRAPAPADELRGFRAGDDEAGDAVAVARADQPVVLARRHARRELQLERALVGGHVLAELDLAHRARRRPAHALGERRERDSRLGQELPRRAGLAEIVSALAEEPEPRPAYVQPGTHAVARLRRRQHRHLALERKPAYARERVGDDLALQGELALVRDVREHVPPARGIGARFPAVFGCVFDLRHLCVDDPAAHLLHARAHAFAWNRPRDEHDLPLVPRNHPAAGGGLLDGERKDGGHKDSTKRESGSRTITRPCTAHVSRHTHHAGGARVQPCSMAREHA